MVALPELAMTKKEIKRARRFKHIKFKHSII